MNMFGREMIKTDVKVVTDANVLELLEKVINEHLTNRTQIEYLWNYYRGKQPILTREKTVRPEICNRIVENRANEIVSFKVGYLCGEPIQLVGRNADELLRKVLALQFVAAHGDEVCPAKWQPGAQTLKPSLDLVGQL